MTDLIVLPANHGDLSMHQTLSRLRLALPLTLTLGLLLGTGLLGCGHSDSHGHVPPSGEAVVDNRTDLTTDEILYNFFLATPGNPFSADLLGGDLLPAEARSVGFFPTNIYDAEGDLELGQIIEWFDVFIGDGDTTFFQVD